MIKDLLISFKDNIQAKSSNPFFGTVVLIWIIKNWNLFFTIYYFEPSTSLAEKRGFIIEHFAKKPFLETILHCLIEGFIVLVISYFLINISRLIINFYEKKVTPFVYKITDSNSIVLKTDFDLLEMNRLKLEKKLEEERQNRINIQDDFEKLEKKYSDLVNELNKIPKSDNNKEINEPENNHSISTNEKMNLILNKLRNEKKIEDFKKISENIMNNIPMRKSTPILMEFTTLGVIIQQKYVEPDVYSYAFTPLGESIKEILLLEQLK